MNFFRYIAMFEPYYTALNHFVAKEIIPCAESKICSYFFAITDLVSILKTDIDFQQRLGISNQPFNVCLFTLAFTCHGSL